MSQNIRNISSLYASIMVRPITWACKIILFHSNPSSRSRDMRDMVKYLNFLKTLGPLLCFAGNNIRKVMTECLESNNRLLTFTHVNMFYDALPAQKWPNGFKEQFRFLNVSLLLELGFEWKKKWFTSPSDGLYMWYCR